MIHVWSVLVQRSIVDRDTNNLSLIDVMEEIKFQISPIPTEKFALPIPCRVVSLWVRSASDQPEKGYARLILKSPDEEAVFVNDMELDLSQYQRFRSITGSNTIPFSGSGQYLFQVQYRSAETEDWQVVAKLPLVISLEEIPPDEMEQINSILS